VSLQKKKDNEILSVFLYMSHCKYVRGKFRQANVRLIVIDICVTLKISHYFIAFTMDKLLVGFSLPAVAL